MGFRLHSFLIISCLVILTLLILSASFVAGLSRIEKQQISTCRKDCSIERRADTKICSGEYYDCADTCRNDFRNCRISLRENRDSCMDICNNKDNRKDKYMCKKECYSIYREDYRNKCNYRECRTSCRDTRDECRDIIREYYPTCRSQCTIVQDNTSVIQETVVENGTTSSCGNDKTEETEECDDGNKENGDECDEYCKIESEFVCTINSAKWEKNRAIEGEEVGFLVGGNNCDGKSINIEIWEKDFGEDDFVNTIKGIQFSGENANGIWVAKYGNEGDGSEAEYYFKVILFDDENVSYQSSFSEMLIVSNEDIQVENPRINDTDLCSGFDDNIIIDKVERPDYCESEKCGNGVVEGSEQCELNNFCVNTGDVCVKCRCVTPGLVNAQINLMQFSSQYSGTGGRMAPHTVHVHATDSDLAGGKWQRAKFEWDFDANNNEATHLTTTDPRTGRTVNLAKEQQGFNAAYVYRTPGTYKIRLVVTNEFGDVGIDEQLVTITVDTRTTYCFSNDNDFAGCPSNVPAVNRVRTSSFSTAMSNEGNNRKLLFERGDLFTMTNGENVGADNLVIDTFGSGGKPEIRYTNSGSGSDTLIDVVGAAESVIIKDLKLSSVRPVQSGNGLTAIEPCGRMNTAWGTELKSDSQNGFGLGVKHTCSNDIGVLLLNHIGGERTWNQQLKTQESRDTVYIGVRTGTSIFEQIFRAVSTGHDAPIEEANKRLNIAWTELVYNPYNSGGKGPMRFQHVNYAYLFRSKLVNGTSQIGHDGAAAYIVVLDGNVINNRKNPEVGKFGANGFLISNVNARDIMLRNNVLINDHGGPLMQMGGGGDCKICAPSKNLDFIGNTVLFRHPKSKFLALGMENYRFNNNLFIAHPDMNEPFTVGGQDESQNNVFPVRPAGYEIAPSWTWQEWINRPVSQNERQENIDINDIYFDDFRPQAKDYPIATTNAKPKPGAFEDYHDNPRPTGAGVDWYAGAVNIN